MQRRTSWMCSSPSCGRQHGHGHTATHRSRLLGEPLGVTDDSIDGASLADRRRRRARRLRDSHVVRADRDEEQRRSNRTRIHSVARSSQIDRSRAATRVLTRRSTVQLAWPAGERGRRCRRTHATMSTPATFLRRRTRPRQDRCSTLAHPGSRAAQIRVDRFWVSLADGCIRSPCCLRCCSGCSWPSASSACPANGCPSALAPVNDLVDSAGWPSRPWTRSNRPSASRGQKSRHRCLPHRPSRCTRTVWRTFRQLR